MRNKQELKHTLNSNIHCRIVFRYHRAICKGNKQSVPLQSLNKPIVWLLQHI